MAKFLESNFNITADTEDFFDFDLDVIFEGDEKSDILCSFLGITTFNVSFCGSAKFDSVLALTELLKSFVDQQVILIPDGADDDENFDYIPAREEYKYVLRFGENWVELYCKLPVEIGWEDK